MNQTHHKYRLCDLGELNPGTSKGFDINIPESGQRLDVFLIRGQGDTRNDLHCYVNQCPHTLVNLNWMPDQFLNLEKTHIQCSTHGALFRIQDGLCVWGPCKGAKLQSMEIVVEAATVFLKIA